MGTYWRFEASGVYDIEPEFTVVVARADASGYLFAAAQAEQLDSVVTWSRAWFGERDRNLNRPYPYSETPGREMLFDFPLVDGKTWQAWPDGPNVTARAANITTPAGTFPGFSITGEREPVRVEWDYVPELGFFTKYVVENTRRTYDLRLVEHGNGSGWVWFDKGPTVSVEWTDPDASTPHATLAVPADMDAIVGLAYGLPGARGGAVPPPGTGAPWTFEATGCCASGDDWTVVNLPATPGDWQLFMGSTTPESWGAIDLAAVRWIRSETTT